MGCGYRKVAGNEMMCGSEDSILAVVDKGSSDESHLKYQDRRRLLNELGLEEGKPQA